MTSEAYHEPVDALTAEVIERHRAITSLMEELEAVDWYDQRVSATQDPDLQAVLAHNRDEEKEHAAMTLEWLRRNDPKWDEVLRTYLFRTEKITAIETAKEREEAEETDRTGVAPTTALAVGDLRRARPR